MYNPFCRNRPDVSIVMLTWNREKGLAMSLEALYAALDNSLKHEILIQNNASTDGTLKLLAQYTGKKETTIINAPDNKGMAAYKRLFNRCKGRIIIEVDDDVLEFPKNFDRTMVEYLDTYRDYCYLALNVVRNEKTLCGRSYGARPIDAKYEIDRRGEMCVERGPAGGWCAAFRNSDYTLISPVFNCLRIGPGRPEDGALIGCFLKLLRYRKHGIIMDATCLHATGPYYAKLLGTYDRELEKHLAGTDELVKRQFLEAKEVK